jgi:hypothetical protein
MEGRNNSWAIRFCYTQFKLNKLTVFPIISKVKNIGFGENSTNCNVYDRFKIYFDIGIKVDFYFPKTGAINYTIIEQVIDFYSVKSRIKAKIFFLLNKYK